MFSDWTFPPVPPELKSLAPYFQRAQELRAKDAVMSYWCTYYAAQQGISSKAQGTDARPFLFQILTILEQMKANLANNDAVADDDVGSAYIENFALRVFNMADNEDRKGQATRSTAKKFLASANFFEVLRIFAKPVESDIEEKIRYAKWKAADLAKAFREGRKPIPGDANASPVEPLSQPGTFDYPPDIAPSISAWSPGTSLAPSPAVQQPQSLELSPIPRARVPLPPLVSDGSPPGYTLHLTSPSPLHAPSSQPDNFVPNTPSTPSPRSSGVYLNLNHKDEGFITPGMWSTVATPGTNEDVYPITDALGGISESPSGRASTQRKDVSGKGMDNDKFAEIDPDLDTQDDSWSTVGNESMSRQNSWTVANPEAIPLVVEGLMVASPSAGIELGLQPHEVPSGGHVKKVHFSPSVVGGLSSTSSSITASSLPGSPEGYAPSLSTVPETTYSSDSEYDAARTAKYDLARNHTRESEPPAKMDGFSQGPPPVVQKVSPPVEPLPPNGLPSHFNVSQMPVPPPVLSTHPHTVGPTLFQFPVAPSQQAGISPQPPVPSLLHPTPQFATAPLAPAPANRSNYNPSKSPSPPELTSTQIARVQKHCRFAISALDYEDTETARKELRSALVMLGD